MNIQIYTHQTKMNKQCKEAQKEYEKRLSKYCKLEVIPCKDENQLTKRLKEGTHTIKITTSKKSMDSVVFSQHLETLGVYGTSTIAFIIGFPTFTTTEELSISQMEFSQELLFITLLEQVYRSYRILKNEPYHK